MKRLIRIGDALSQLCNVIFFNGHPNESMSGRSYREGRKSEKWINKILWFDPNHCRESYRNDLKYAAELLRFPK